MTKAAEGSVWAVNLDKVEWERTRETATLLSAVADGTSMRVRMLANERPFPQAALAVPSIEDAYLHLMSKEGHPV